MRVDKETLFKSVIQQYSELYPMTMNQGNDLLKVLTLVFEKVDMNIQEGALSTQITANEIIVKNFLGVKQLSGKRKSTVKAYKHAIDFFISNTGYDLINITTNDIRRFLLWYQNSGASMVTVNNARRVLNLLFQFMEDEGYIDRNPCKRISYIKCEKPIKRFYSDAEMECIRDACKTTRELAIVDFLQSTGVRVSELSNIKLSDVNFDKDIILIHGKGGKDRYVYMNARASKHVRDYIKERPSGEYLFCGSHRPYDNLKKDTINHIISKIGARVDLPDITVHDFRRWFANDLNRKGVDIRIIQQLLGHESFTTTQNYYLQVDNEKARQAHNIFAN